MTRLGMRGRRKGTLASTNPYVSIIEAVPRVAQRQALAVRRHVRRSSTRTKSASRTTSAPTTRSPSTATVSRAVRTSSPPISDRTVTPPACGLAHAGTTTTTRAPRTGGVSRAFAYGRSGVPEPFRGPPRPGGSTTSSDGHMLGSRSTRNASCNPRLEPGNGHGQPRGAKRPMGLFRPRPGRLFNRRKKRQFAGLFSMARPGLEPGTPRFSVVRSWVGRETEIPGKTRFPVLRCHARSAGGCWLCPRTEGMNRVSSPNWDVSSLRDARSRWSEIIGNPIPS